MLLQCFILLIDHSNFFICNVCWLVRFSESSEDFLSVVFLSANQSKINNKIVHLRSLRKSGTQTCWLTNDLYRLLPLIMSLTQSGWPVFMYFFHFVYYFTLKYSIDRSGYLIRIYDRPTVPRIDSGFGLIG